MVTCTKMLLICLTVTVLVVPQRGRCDTEDLSARDLTLAEAEDESANNFMEDKSARRFTEDSTTRNLTLVEKMSDWNAEQASVQAPKPLTKEKYRSKRQQVANAIRKKKKSWVAGDNPLFMKQNISDISGLFGARRVAAPVQAPLLADPSVLGPPKVRRLPPKRGGGNETFYEDDIFDTSRLKRSNSLPTTYDIRTEYPECTSISSIRTQKGCGGCYAFASASVMSDRHCIYNYRRTGQVFISPFHVLMCVPDGCNGGTEWDPLEYWKKYGLVTGGAGDPWSYQPDGCLPVPDYPNHVPRSCPTSCSNRYYSKSFDDDKIYGGASGHKWFPSVEWIQNEIYKYGPVIAFLSVYEDFMYFYRGGVYEYVSGKKLGPHTVKLIGWGTEGGVDYWLAVNSWGSNWGQRGVFKIRRGVNTAQIEARISWALPKEAVF